MNALDAGKVRDASIQDYDFLVSPTVPPSTAIEIRAGKAWRNSVYWAVIAYNVQKPAERLDLATSNDIGRYSAAPPGAALSLIFGNPHYYRPICLALNYEWIFWEEDSEWDGVGGHKYYFVGPSTEYPTAAEAEAEVDALLNGGYRTTYEYHLYNYRYFALWSIIVRGDAAGTGILPIDRLNRGRSYLYRDLRPGKNWILG